MIETPVILFIYNRPDTTARVLDVVRAAQPTRLFVVADGPRPDRPDDLERCASARAVIDTVDWPCERITHYAEDNLGVGRRVSSGLDWLFGQVDEAVILEDDCVPDPSFFHYCAELLDVYRHDDRIAHISGANPLGVWQADRQGYHFSRYGQHWGWATWRRAWRRYDFAMTALDSPDTLARLAAVTGDPEYATYHAQLCLLISQGRIDAWDVQWTLGQLLRNELSVVPSVNLVTNIGFGRHATHTRLSLALSAGAVRHRLTFPLRSPSIENRDPAPTVDPEYDRRYVAWRLGRPAIGQVIETADRLLASGRYSQPLLLLEAALKAKLVMTPQEHAQAHVLRACALQALGQPGRARAAAREALALWPHDREAAELVAQMDG